MANEKKNVQNQNSIKALASEKKNVQNQNSIKALASELTSEELKAEQLVFALAKAGMHDQIETALSQLGMAISAEEHEAARPKSAKEQALALAASLGLDLAMPKASGKLAVNIESLAKAFGKYGKHCYAADAENGTSLVTRSVTRQLVETGKCSLPETLADVRKHLPNYSSTGHYNTLKRLLKAEGFLVSVSQANFSITA